MSDASTITTTVEPASADVESVLALAERARSVDGVPPLNEAALLQLRHPRVGVQHLLLARDGAVLGYAQLEAGPGTSLTQLVVDPEHRRLGLGTELADRVVALAPSGLRAWSAGATPGAAALAARVGMRVGRELSIMRRGLDGAWPDPPVPESVQIRAFRVGTDEPGWLAVNARAFAHHPEQGSITAVELAERMAEPWFDPAGFLVATRSGVMVGFHWTKEHGDQLGEVYVLGVDPAAGGAGLGKVLLTAGLRHLRERGNTAVELYVESDHPQAVGLYRGYGFATVSRDVMYVQPASADQVSPGGH